MKTILSQLFMPLPLIFMLLVLAVILRRRKRTSRLLLGVSFVWLLAVSTFPLPDMLTKSLEDRYEVFTVSKILQKGKPVHLLILGGGHSNDSRLPANNQLSLNALGRLVEGIRLHRQIPGSIIITSGWSGSRNTTQAEVLAKTAILLGVDSKAIKMQILPKNTQMEALEYKSIFGDTAQLIIVTNAMHMQRVMFLFRKAGLKPLAAPTNHQVKKRSKKDWERWIPSSSNIHKMEKVIHEYGGLIWYRMKK